MPGEEIQGRIAFADIFEKAIQKFKEELGKLGCLSADIPQVGILIIGIEAAVSISANLDAVTKDRLQMSSRRVIQLVELLRCSLPHGRGFLCIAIIGLVPNFPVTNRILKSIRPTVDIMGHHMLADHRPFLKILRGIEAVRFEHMIIFDGHTQTEKGLTTMLHKLLDDAICKGKIIGCGIVGIRIEITEEIRNVHIQTSPHPPAYIVQTGVGDTCILQI